MLFGHFQCFNATLPRSDAVRMLAPPTPNTRLPAGHFPRSEFLCPSFQNHAFSSCPALPAPINPPTELWPSGRRHTPAKGADGNVSRVRIPSAPPLAHCKPENRSLAGPFSLCAKGVCKDHPPFGDWPAARDRSPNAHRLFPPAPRSRRDGFKIPIDFNELTRSRCAGVSLVPACLDGDGDTTRAAWSLVCLGSFARSL